MSGNYGSIRRLVKIKEQSYATINSTKYMSGDLDNETLHEFSIVINNTELLYGKVRDPVYQIDLAQEKITINITNISSTLNTTRKDCFNINLTKIYAKDPAFVRIQLFTEPVIDGVPYHAINTEGMYATLPYVNNTISLTVDPSFIPWSNYPQVYLTLTFNLVKNASAPAYCSAYDGSRFLNNSLTSAFDYNYNPDNVKQPELIDGVLEVNTGSGYRTKSETLMTGLGAAFKYEIQSGAPTFTVKFTDQSTGSPVDWEWDFTNDGTVDTTLNNPTNSYGAPGIKTVKLTVKDAAGISASINKTVDLSTPVASFNTAPSPATGTIPLTVTFTDTSTGGAPTIWDWDFGDASPHSYNVTSIAHTYNVAGSYTAQLTVSNIFGSSSATNAITVIPPAPVADFNTTPSPATGNAPLVVTFTDTSTGGTPTIWDWDFGDASPHSYNVTSIAHTYNVAGSYTAQLTVSNAGGSSSTTKPVSVGIFVGPPVAAFSVNTTSGNAPLNVQFTDSSTGSITAYAWDFNNDGTIDSTSPSPSYTYATAGTYTVNLTVTGPGGSDVELKTNYITVYTILSFSTVGMSSWTAPAGITSVEYLVIAGGGAGGSWGAGGGAGGFRTASGYAVIPGNSYTVSVGAGGAGGAGSGGNGTNSVFATITAIGGGGGGGAGDPNGKAGGSGGGARGNIANPVGLGTAGQGNNGGTGLRSSATYILGGGGGGASVAGGAVTGSSPNSVGGVGGEGRFSSITGINTQYAGGGGGGADSDVGLSGGSGGGGGGGAGSTGTGVSGTNGSGGGGGGSGSGVNGSTGGSGIVIIKFH
jgi:PKD repeat protein